MNVEPIFENKFKDFINNTHTCPMRKLENTGRHKEG